MFPGSGKEPRFFYGYIIVLASFLAVMMVWGAQYSFGVFFKPVLNEFGWSRALTSGVYSLNSFLIGFFGIFTGRLNDRFGPRVVVTACGLLIGLSYLLMSQVAAIWQIYLFYGVLLSMGIAGMWVPLMSTVARWFTKRRGLAGGIVASGIGVGTIIMPPVANHLISSYTWRTSYVIVGLSVLAITVIIAQFLRRAPGQMGLLAYGADAVKTGSPNLGDRGFSLREALRTSQFWIISIGILFGSVAVQTAMVHIVPHATDLGISEGTAAIILSIVGVVSVVGKVGMGSAGDRIGNKRVIIIGFILMALAFLWLLVANELWMFGLFAIAFGLSYGAFAAAPSPMLAELFDLKAHGAIFGLVMFAANVGGAIGPLVAGRTFDVTNNYYLAFILCAAVSVIGIILTLLLKHTRKEGSV